MRLMHTDTFSLHVVLRRGWCCKHFEQAGHELSMVPNPTRGQLNRVIFFPCSLFRACEFGIGSYVRLSRLASVYSFSTPRLNLVLITGLRSPFLLLPATVPIRTVIRDWVSSEFIRSRNCVTDGFHQRELPGVGPIHPR